MLARSARPGATRTRRASAPRPIASSALADAHSATCNRRQRRKAIASPDETGAPPTVHVRATTRAAPPISSTAATRTASAERLRIVSDNCPPTSPTGSRCRRSSNSRCSRCQPRPSVRSPSPPPPKPRHPLRKRPPLPAPFPHGPASIPNREHRKSSSKRRARRKGRNLEDFLGLVRQKNGGADLAPPSDDSKTR